MLISLCIPCHARTSDLKRVMPFLLVAANYSPPVEIVVVDYTSPDDLREFMGKVMNSYLERGNIIVYRHYGKRDYYHMAHARNLSVMAASGEYIVISSADIILAENFFAKIRSILEETGADWLQPRRYQGVIVCKRSEFIAAGGYDERFEYYGPEDRDLALRLERRGLKKGRYPSNLLTVLYTPREEKARNYRIRSLWRMKDEMHKIFKENIANGVLVANEGVEWGAW